ncbi:MAG: DUF4168 domain-containing protein [Vitreimonas sp.]
MSRNTWLAAAAAIALAAGACTSDGGDVTADTMGRSADSMAPSAAPPPPSHAATPGGATYSDDQLRAFAAASAEINPIAHTLPTATPEQRAAAATQIRGILQQHNLDAATYNGIASRAQSDPAFAERIRSLMN